MAVTPEAYSCKSAGITATQTLWCSVAAKGTLCACQVEQTQETPGQGERGQKSV